jgi:hypothetical protein
VDKIQQEVGLPYNGGSARGYLPGFVWLADAVMVQRVSGCPYAYASATSG